MTQDNSGMWSQSAEQLQQQMVSGWAGALQALQSLMPPMQAGLPSLPDLPAPALHFAPEKLQQLQQQYVQEATELWSDALAGKAQARDKRFADAAWSANPMAAFAAANYLLHSRALIGLADAVEADEKTRARVRFAVEQWLAAAAPSNFLALNAEAQKKAIETKGESIARGLENLLHDIRQGHVSMTDESLFEVGKNVATTEGAVVFENELFQLLEYKPLTARVF